MLRRRLSWVVEASPISEHTLWFHQQLQIERHRSAALADELERRIREGQDLQEQVENARSTAGSDNHGALLTHFNGDSLAGGASSASAGSHGHPAYGSATSMLAGTTREGSVGAQRHIMSVIRERSSAEVAAAQQNAAMPGALQQLRSGGQISGPLLHNSSSSRIVQASPLPARDITPIPPSGSPGIRSIGPQLSHSSSTPLRSEQGGTPRVVDYRGTAFSVLR
jgi:hypothetical protein